MIGIIFGPPGSGKGTQATRIQSEFRLTHLSTGEILRAEVAKGSDIGREVGRIMAAGALVPDDLIVGIVRGRLPGSEAGAGVLLDGFPRTVEQARALDAMLSAEGRPGVDLVIFLDVPERVLVERLLHRAAVEGRADDTREAITGRMHEYRTVTAAVLDHYREDGVRVAEIDGVGEVGEVFNRIRAAIRSSRR